VTSQRGHERKRTQRVELLIGIRTSSVVFMEFTGPTPLSVKVEFVARTQICAVLSETLKQAGKLSDVPEPGFWKHWKRKLASLKSESAASVLQEGHKERRRELLG
jgi:hypothetical protein